MLGSALIGGRRKCEILSAVMDHPENVRVTIITKSYDE
jgi:hypothetical protein